ncbi:Smr/MutS family protein [Legionella micdadei]|uniref:Smr/MutS family protein n=1 Tax=Legionella micdadei TaxID=451 RepID=UPI0009EF7FFD|nr:Smr/MutS family protein [Legionella micdadei]ARG99487.1 hypothetical protein B6V88_03120 [Legionella micdadei]
MSDDSLSEEDKALFRKMMSDVKPLKKNDKISLVSTTAKNRKRESVTVTKTTTVYLSDYYAEEVQANTILSYTSSPLPNKRLRELKTGKIPWQAKLDLHGLKPDDAKEALVKFIGQQFALAHRSLLIIHGKGSHKGEAPVLKNLVNRWLTQFPQVLAFHSALARDGGEGALYVLLKRQKEETN